MPNAKPLTSAQLDAVRENYKDAVTFCENGGVPGCCICTIQALLATLDERDRKLAAYRAMRHAVTFPQLSNAAGILNAIDPLFDNAQEAHAECDKQLAIARGGQGATDAE